MNDKDKVSDDKESNTSMWPAPWMYESDSQYDTFIVLVQLLEHTTSSFCRQIIVSLLFHINMPGIICATRFIFRLF